MTITESTTAVLDISVALLDPHPLNIRHSLGDLTDLVRSVKSVGVVEPLVVLPADESGRHRIIAGHRRHAAATKVELPTVPCIIRPMDEAEVLEAMLAENGDGIRARITLVEEAEAYARLMTLRDGLSIKALAARVGRSQTYVRTRLVILALPAKALDRLHRGEMSLDVATALAKVADDAELIEALLTGERLDEWTIERATKARDVERERAEREVDLIATGVRVLTADEVAAAKRLDTVLSDKADRRRHRKEPCHAAAVATGWEGVNVVEYCTDPRRHRSSAPAADRSEIVQTGTTRQASPDDDRRKSDTADRSARRQFLTDKLGTGGLPQATTARFAFQALVAMANQHRTNAVAALLGIEPPSDAATSIGEALAEHAMASSKHLVTVAALVAAMTADERTGPFRTTLTDDPLLVAYYRWLSDLGYEPTEHERQLLDTVGR